MLKSTNGFTPILVFIKYSKHLCEKKVTSSVTRHMPTLMLSIILIVYYIM